MMTLSGSGNPMMAMHMCSWICSSESTASSNMVRIHSINSWPFNWAVSPAMSVNFEAGNNVVGSSSLGFSGASSCRHDKVSMALFQFLGRYWMM